MKTLIRNALLVTMNRQNDVIENGSIVIDGNKLVYVGPTPSMPTGPVDKTIEGDRYIAMPGMVNAHCHSPANLVRGMLPSKPLEIWRAYYRASLRDMCDEDFYASALLGGMKCSRTARLQSSITFSAIKPVPSWGWVARFKPCAILGCAMLFHSRFPTRTMKRQSH